MPAEIIISAAFEARTTALALGLKAALTEELDMVMQEVQRMARAEADWHADKTVVTTSIGFDYEVTGASRRGIVGYAVGAAREAFEDFSYEDTVTSSHANRVHQSDASVSPVPEPGMYEVMGVVTMYEDHAGFLQARERGDLVGTAGGVDPPSPLRRDGQQITTRVLMDHEQEILAMITAGARLALTGL